MPQHSINMAAMSESSSGVDRPETGSGDRAGRLRISSYWLDVTAGANASEFDDAVLTGAVEKPEPWLTRINYDLFGGSGTYLWVKSLEGVVFGICDLVSPETARIKYWADVSTLMIRASLSADCAYTFPGHASMTFNRPEVVVAYMPEGAEIDVDVHAGTRQHSVILMMDARAFAPQFKLGQDSMPGILNEMLQGRGAPGRLITLPLTSRLGGIVESMTRPMRNPGLRRLALSGLLAELIAVILESAEGNPAFAGAGGLRQRDVDLAHAARDKLDQTAIAGVRLGNVARAVGTNQKTLKVVFRKVFGMTMSDYCVQRRMQLAQSLLLEGRLSVGQVAGNVGYEHQSSFTAAFRAYSGMTPRDYQRQRAAVDISLPLRPEPAGRKA